MTGGAPSDGGVDILPPKAAYNLGAFGYSRRNWCRIWDELEWPIVRGWIRKAPKGLLLDAGCGPGLLSERLRAEGFRTIGIDLSEGMSRESSRRGGDAVCADFAAAPFRDGTFHAIVCLQAICHAESKPEVLGEFRRLLAPGGVLVVSDVDASAGSSTRLDAGGGREVRAWTERLDPESAAKLAGSAGLSILGSSSVSAGAVAAERPLRRLDVPAEAPFLHLFLLGEK